MRELSIREKLASLKAKVRMGERILPSEVESLMPKRDSAQTLSKEERDLWLTLLLLSENQDKEEEMDKVISSLMSTFSEREEEEIFKGDAETIILVTDSFLNLGRNHHRLVFSFKSDQCFLHFGPLVFPIQDSLERVQEIRDMLVSVFSLTSSYATEEEELWKVVIKDGRNNSYLFSGSCIFPFFLFPHFSFDNLPEYLRVPDVGGRDTFTFISFHYSRLEKDGKGKVLEKLVLDEENELIEIEKESSKENLRYAKKGQSKSIGKVLSQIDVYGFYPDSWDMDLSSFFREDTKDEEYRRTRFFFTGKTKYNREIKWEGSFMSLTLPKPWYKASLSIRRHFPYSLSLESTEPSLVNMPPTDKETIYVAGVAYTDQEYEKEYSYISPFGLVRPGLEVVVPVGAKNARRNATVKSVQAFRKKEDIPFPNMKEIIAIL